LLYPACDLLYSGSSVSDTADAFPVEIMRYYTRHLNKPFVFTIAVVIEAEATQSVGPVLIEHKIEDRKFGIDPQ
jgi:hypothetical protein